MILLRYKSNNMTPLPLTSAHNDLKAIHNLELHLLVPCFSYSGPDSLVSFLSWKLNSCVLTCGLLYLLLPLLGILQHTCRLILRSCLSLSSMVIFPKEPFLSVPLKCVLSLASTTKLPILFHGYIVLHRSYFLRCY